jgi:uncharacterized protein with von Willebrand factor type A (vWA) domain
LDPILAVQERVLAKDSERITRALTLIRKARTKLASGDILSIDDLATLTHETVLTKLSKKSMKQLMEEAKALMTSGDATTATAMDFARCFRATTEHLKSMRFHTASTLSRRFEMTASRPRDPNLEAQ